jgi:hypothetical protein
MAVVRVEKVLVLVAATNCMTGTLGGGFVMTSKTEVAVVRVDKVLVLVAANKQTERN